MSKKEYIRFLKNKIILILTLIIGSILSLLFFAKVTIFRNELSGIGTLFLLNEVDFNLFEYIEIIFISYFSSLFGAYSGVINNISFTTKQLILSLSPFPSYFHGLSADYWSKIERVSIFAPASTYLELYQSNFIFSLFVSTLFAFLFSLKKLTVRVLSKLKDKYELLKFIPFSIEFSGTVALLYGFQYGTRTTMRYYWIVFSLIILIPIILGIVFKFKKEIRFNHK